MYINWIPELKPNRIRLPKPTAIPPTAVLHFGAWKKRVHVEISDQLPQNSIGLSAHLKSEVTMPDTLPYEIYATGRNLHIGPVIAFLISTKKLSPKLLENYRGYFARYEVVKGLIYLCSLDGINPRKKTIEGYYYNPQADGNKTPWIKGILPYPSVVYKRIGVIKNKVYDDLIVQTKRKIFNPYFLNKWDLWELMRFNPLICEHLPYTRLLNNKQTMKQMLTSYGSVYVKPANGSMGLGIMKVEKTPKGYFFINRYKKKTLLKNGSGAWALIRRMRNGRRYLIQQSVSLTHQNKNVDFRVIMQKDGSERWTCTGIIARFGEDGRFYTNRASLMCLGRDALQSIFQLSMEEAVRKEEEIILICTTACQLIDNKYGSFGDVGIDVTVDSNLKVWLLEINSRHQHTIPSYLQDDLQMYKKVLTSPLEYAKSWAGFTDENIRHMGMNKTPG